MRYTVIGLMSGSSLDGLDIVFAELNEQSGGWSYEILQAACYPYDAEWTEKLQNAGQLTALAYQYLHTEYGRYLGQQVKEFIASNDLHFRVQLLSSHGHTVFHDPARRMTAQLGDGAALAASTGLPVISDLRALDIALGGQGAPIVPIGERLLFGEYSLFLNLGGIANLSSHIRSRPGEEEAGGGQREGVLAFDVCPASRILNLLANLKGKEYDEGGNLATEGRVLEPLLRELNALEYYAQAPPKSLANQFGTEVIYPMIRLSGCSPEDGLRTYVEHICIQIKNSLSGLLSPVGHSGKAGNAASPHRMLVTGGSALNGFLIGRLRENLSDWPVEIVIPDLTLVKYKEALIMGLIGVLRWREETNVLATVTGACRNSAGGAVWLGEAE
jgi:anhydro-N-acetylmuramic acid kinase